MASASSRWKHNRLRPSAIAATFTAQLLTGVPSKLWPVQLRHRLSLRSIVITYFNLWVPHHTGYFGLCEKCLGFALFFLSLPPQKQAGSLFQTTPSPCTVSSSTDCLISSESATSDEPQLAWSWAKDFSLQFSCTTRSK